MSDIPGKRGTSATKQRQKLGRKREKLILNFGNNTYIDVSLLAGPGFY